LKPEEVGMGDSGFDGSYKYGIQIDTPPNRVHAALYRAFSSFRIRVENVIADIKDWKAARDQVRIPLKNKDQLLSTHHKIWAIASVFINRYRR